jgi:hypothetical protein
MLCEVYLKWLDPHPVWTDPDPDIKSVKFYLLNVKPHNNLLIQNSNCGINLSVNNVLKFWFSIDTVFNTVCTVRYSYIQSFFKFSYYSYQVSVN